MPQRASYFVEEIITAEGLGSNTTHDMVQDDDCFLWVATRDGLNRFDGTEVTQYFCSSSILAKCSRRKTQRPRGLPCLILFGSQPKENTVSQEFEWWTLASTNYRIAVGCSAFAL